MARQYYKDSTTGQMKPIVVKVEDTLPTGFEGDIPDGTPIPEGWEEVPDGSVIVSVTEPQGNDRRKVWKQHSNNLYANSNEMGNIKDDGTDGSADNYSRTKGFISVSANITYSLGLNNSSDQIRAYYYNNNKTFISADVIGSSANEATFTPPANTSFVRFRYRGTSIFTTWLNKGTTILPYEPYAEDKEYILNDNDEYEEYTPQNEIYSTDEVRIGTWIDGKPLYRKTFVNTYSNVSNINDFITISIPNIKCIVKYETNATINTVQVIGTGSEFNTWFNTNTQYRIQFVNIDATKTYTIYTHAYYLKTTD